MTTPSKRRHQNNQGGVRESWDETGRVRRDSFEICGGIKESQEEQKLEIYISTTQRVISTSLIQPTNRVYIWGFDLHNQHNKIFDLHLALRFDSQLGHSLFQTVC